MASSEEAQSIQSPDQMIQEEGARLIADENGTILYTNASFLNLCDLDSVIQAENLSDIFSFEPSSEFLTDGLHQVLTINTGKELSLQFNKIESPDGKYFLVISAEVISAGEKLLQFVTEKIEQKNNFSSDQTPFIDLSFDACCITETDGAFQTINQNFSNLLGYRIEDLQNYIFTDIIHPQDRNEYRTHIQNLRNNDDNQQTISLEMLCIHQDGSERLIEWNHKFTNGKTYSAGRDLTPLRTYHQSLQRQEKKLAEAEAIGHIGQWCWPVGAEEIEFSNQLFSIFGLIKADFNPTLDNVNNMIHRQDAGRMMQVFQRAIIEQNNYDMDFRIIRPDGEVRFIHCEGRCETNNEDEVIALYGIMQDVTETTKRELDLRQAKESVERAYNAKSQFLANMSHELRTPLNAVIGFSEMIERQLLGPIGTEKYLEYIAGIRESGEHLLDLISDILDMSKIEAGKYELSIEQFNIAKVMRMAAHMMEGRALDADIKINIDISNEELNITADRRAVMQMILNLLSNAVKFSKHSSKITMRLIEHSDTISLRVEDEGIGIPANKLANITMPFEQAESDYTREYEGSGLGLAITKDLAEIHGGSIQIDSTINVGTTVIIRLPYEVKK